LLGFYQPDEALQLVKNQGVELVTPDDEWKQQIARARQTVESVKAQQVPSTALGPLGTEYDSRVAKLRSESTFVEHLQGSASAEFAWVELPTLRSFQPQLNEEYIERLVRTGPPPDDQAGTVAFCLPTKEERPKTQILAGFNPTTNTFTAVTENLDLRVLGSAQSEDPVSGRKIAGFLWGFGLPQISVAEYSGMFFLKNGYHRAFALLKLGHTKLPCLLLHTQLFQFTGAQAPGMFNVDIVRASRGPILSDFQSDAAVSVPHRRLRLLLSVHAEVQAVPV
jgi:hypothetical protein